MKSRFHEAADAELAEAILYYDAKASGLGDRFLAEVKAATRSVEQYHEIAQMIDVAVRAKVLVSFPYSVMYVMDPDELFIVAVAIIVSDLRIGLTDCPRNRAANFTLKLSRPGFGPAAELPTFRQSDGVTPVAVRVALLQLNRGNRRAASASARGPWPCSLGDRR